MKRHLVLILTIGLCTGVLAAEAQTEMQPDVAATADTVAPTVPPTPTAEATAPMSDKSATELWDAANTAYINGDFHTAAATYEQLLDRNIASAKLYYNLANAYFKEDRLGKAILSYHRALRLAPGNDDIRYNLGVAEARTKDNIEDIPEFFLTEWMRSIRHTMGCTAWTVLSLVLLAAALMLFLMYLLAQRLGLRKTGFYGTLLAALLFVCATAFALGERREMLDRSHAVVMATSAAIKSSPDKSATDLFVLHEGTLVRILDGLDGWSEIVIADGKKGWLETRQIETI